MEWHYVKDGVQTGPVSEETFRSLIQQGDIRPETLVWRVGMPQWIPRAECVDGASGGPSCGECGKEFAPDDLVTIGAIRVCGGCKAQLIQRLRQGAMPSGDGSGLFADGRRLVVLKETSMPMRCVCCGNSATIQLKRTYLWTPVWVYVLIPVGLLLAALVSVFVSKRFKLEVPLCEAHRVQRRNRMMGAWGWGLASLTLMGLAISQIVGNNDVGGWVALLIGAFVSALAALAMGQRWAGVLVVNRITKTGASFKNAGLEFLSGLPVWTGGKDF